MHESGGLSPGSSVSHYRIRRGLCVDMREVYLADDLRPDVSAVLESLPIKSIQDEEARRGQMGEARTQPALIRRTVTRSGKPFHP